MADTTFTIGSAAACTDGPCGAVRRVVVDPVARDVTHLVVEPEHRSGLGRLVPLDLVEVAGDGVRLRCTLEEFEKLPRAEETDFLPGGSGYQDYAQHEAYYWPYYGLEGGADPAVANASGILTRDALPPGEVGVRRGESVHATDGEIGKVEGLVVDPAHGHVTHVLLKEGHLWGRKQVTIPIAAVDAHGRRHQREPHEARNRGPPFRRPLRAGSVALRAPGQAVPEHVRRALGAGDSPAAGSDPVFPAVQGPQQGCLLALVARHAAEDVVEHDDRRVDVRALVQHHALRPLRHGGIGHLGP